MNSRKQSIFHIFIIIFIVIMSAFLYIQNRELGFLDFLSAKLDSIIPLTILMITSLIEICDSRRKKLNGQWRVQIHPENWPGRSVHYVGEGHMILILEKGKYTGYMHVEWKNVAGETILNTLYELELFSRFGVKVNGTSLLKIRGEYGDGIEDVDNARVTTCSYELKLSEKGRKLSGRLTMSRTATTSTFSAIKEIDE